MRPGPKIKDIVGERFDRWLVLSLSRSNDGRVYWNCKCDCGNAREVRSDRLIGGMSKSCGCYHKEIVARSSSEHNGTHRMSHTKIHRVWRLMKSRCGNPNDKSWPNYGGRGIKVCERWLHSFEKFYADMGDIPFDGAQIDRVDNDGHYEPGNCRWSTAKENSNNRRSTKKIVFRGETHSVLEWSHIIGIHASLLYGRLSRGWSVEDAFGKPPRNASPNVLRNH